jgi:hypothetical protein
MYKVQETSGSQRHIPSSKPFRIQVILYLPKSVELVPRIYLLIYIYMYIFICLLFLLDYSEDIGNEE